MWGIRGLSKSIRTQILAKRPLATEVVMLSIWRKVPVEEDFDPSLQAVCLL